LLRPSSKKVVNAQVKLAELLVILDEARSTKAEDEDNSEEEYVEDDNNEDSASVLITVKRKLITAQRDMRKAFAELENLSL